MRCNRLGLSIVALNLILSGTILSACFHKKTKVTTPSPPPPAVLPSPDSAEKHFKAGEYLGAAQAYEDYLKANPQVRDRDRILFRLAISYALAGGEPDNFRKAQNLLRTLFTQFPDSQYKAEIQYILSLQTDIDRLRVDLSEKGDRVHEQDETIQQQAAALADKDKTIQEKDKVLRDKERSLREKERILNERDKALEEMEDKVLKLTQELERMKKIDLQRRPSRPPG